MQKPLILIVDDTPQNIQVISNVLYGKGYSINISPSGAHALRSVAKQLPDLILLDIQMPEMDGFEVCKSLKSNILTKDIPVIFLSAVTDIEKVVTGFEIGAVDYITKPFRMNELLSRVATHVELKRSREKLIELNATKDKFFNIIAHDLRNPFSSIMGSSEMLVNYDDKLSPEKKLNYAKRIFSSATNAYKLLENLLVWARSQTGKIEFIPVKSNSVDFISEIISLSEVSCHSKNISLSYTGIKYLEIWADVNMFKTILRNLVGNAIKYTPKNGWIEIRSEIVSNEIQFEVVDSGIGLDPVQIKKLFLINEVSSTPGTENETGTGLGLMLCKEFVEKHKGKIWVESELGNGSRFIFTIPISNQEI